MTAGQMLLIIAAAFLVVLLLGHPLPFTLGGLAVLFGVTFWGNPGVLNLFVRTVANTTSNIIYVSTPLFIFMGAFLERSGSADEMFESMYIIFGRLKGGLGIAVTVMCTFLAAATGIIGASLTMMTMIALPVMQKHGYNTRLATGTIMASGCLGTLIPPSIILILYGAQAQISIGQLFAGGVGAGLVLSVLYMVYILIISHVKPEYAPAISPEEAAQYTVRQKVEMIFKSIVPTLGLIILVLGSIITGAATPVEAAALGCVGAFLIALFNRKVNWTMIKDCCYTTIKTTSMIMWIVLGASMFTSVFMGLGGRELIMGLVSGLNVNRWVVLALVLFILLIMGMFIDSLGVLLIGIPVFTPIVYALGFDPLWFAIMFAVMIQVSYLSPPFAYAAFYVKGAAKTDIPIGELYKATYPFLAMQILGLIILSVFPALITWIPSVVM